MFSTIPNDTAPEASPAETASGTSTLPAAAPAAALLATLLLIPGLHTVSAQESSGHNTMFHSSVEWMDTPLNSLSDEQLEDGWRMLWDGQTTSGWRGARLEAFPSNGWLIADGYLSSTEADGAESANGGDIVTIEQFQDFILELEFMISPGGNSGIKYFVDLNLNQGAGSAIGCEYQILDDDGHPDPGGVDGNRLTGALYDLIPAAQENKVFLGSNQWNTVRIEVRGNRVAHYLNGARIVQYERATQQWRALVAYSKYRVWPNFCSGQSGHILLQDHGDEARFRNIRIKALEPIQLPTAKRTQ